MTTARGQEELPFEVPTPRHRVVALPVNTWPKVRFSGQQASPAHAFVVGRGAAERLFDLSASEFGAVVHPVLTSDAMLGGVGVNRWIIDIDERKEPAARRIYPVLMDHLEKFALPARRLAKEKEHKKNIRRQEVDPDATAAERYAREFDVWWTLVGPRREMLRATSRLDRYLVTPTAPPRGATSIVTFVDSSTRADETLMVYALSDDYSFGVLTSEAYSTWVRARTTDAKTTERRPGSFAWSSFPWPQTPSERQVAVIAELADSILTNRASRLRQGASLAAQYGMEAEPKSQALIDLTAELDRAVLDAYDIRGMRQVVERLESLNRDVAADPAAARGPGISTAEARRSNYCLPGPDWPPT
ncbi:hypothetical protein [Modestobacter sp. URMC 112]